MSHLQRQLGHYENTRINVNMRMCGIVDRTHVVEGAICGAVR